MKLIFTAAANKKYAQRAMRQGFLYGARLPATVYYPPYFVDQEYKDPDRDGYMRALAEHKPAIATVLDLEHEEQFDEVLSWADEAARYVQESVIIIPKVDGIIKWLPRYMRGKSVRLGYSVLSSYGQTEVNWREFRNWDVHLLGGSPHRQLAYTKLLNVVSVDINDAMNIARRNQVWHAIPVHQAANKRAPQLKEIGLGHLTEETCYVAAEMTFENYRKAKESGEWIAQLPLF